MNTQLVTLDVSKTPAAAPVLHLGQGDRNGTTLECALYDGGAALDLAGKSARFCMMLPDRKTYYSADGSVSGNVAVFQVDESRAAAVAGTTDVAYVEVLEGDEVICSTSRFAVVVLRGAREGAVLGETYSCEIDAALASLAAQGESSAEAEARREAAEAARASAEAARAAAEAARAKAEDARASAEESRVAAEADRAAAWTELKAELRAEFEASLYSRVDELESWVGELHPLVPEEVTWADGSWHDIARMLEAHYAGEIDIHDYWSVGDERVVQIAAMPAEGVDETHIAQTVPLVLVSADHYDLSDGTGKAAFVWMQKHSLRVTQPFPEKGYMNPTDTTAGGWDACARRAWCNGAYFDALPYGLQRISKTVEISTAGGTGPSTVVSLDKVFLPSETEWFGAQKMANPTAEASHSQYEYLAQSVASLNSKDFISNWWFRSPVGTASKYFVSHFITGLDTSLASENRGIAPCGCI